MSKPSINILNKPAPLPNTFLNCYEVTNPTGLEWPVRTYKVERLDGRPIAHEERGAIKDAIWKLRAQHSEHCPGSSYVIDVDPTTIAVSDQWDIPVPADYGDYKVTVGQDFTVRASDGENQELVSAIIREGLKTYLKRNTSEELGALWQDFDSFCQLPCADEEEGGGGICRKFDIASKVLRGGKRVIECIIGTTVIDSKTFADYYREGYVDVLSEMIAAKQDKKLNRQGKPFGVRAVRESSTGYEIKAVDIDDPTLITGHAKLSRVKQAEHSTSTISCHSYGQPSVEVPLSELKLIFDTQITQEDHAETILEPHERERLMHIMQDFINGAEIYGQPIFLSQTPFDAANLRRTFVLPPSLRVRGANETEEILEAPTSASEDALRKRARRRSEHIRRYGFLQQRPINPLLAWTRSAGEQPADRLLEDMNRILEEQGINYRFTLFRYDTVEEIKREVEQKEFDALLAVLPEGKEPPYDENDTHEQIKRRIDVPSQCIHFNNTLSTNWTRRPVEELEAQKPKLARQIRQRYELCIGGLLVKHHWVPFAPADAFKYNVQVGLDVGGSHNTDVVSCLGYGFQSPADGLLFRPDKIPVSIGKAEPIPSGSLYKGLLDQFVDMHSLLTSANRLPDFERVLFLRDGRLLGDGDRWNEGQDLERLHADLLSRGWISSASVWTVVEVMKDAEGWRFFRNVGTVTNVLAGECIFPYDDENTALVCTTGSQFLTQGTACPLMIRVIDIYGQAKCEDVIRDVVWGADMCFTKPDTGMRLPWVLYVADTGALQQSRSYSITGITAS
jgi:hypothetical protein